MDLEFGSLVESELAVDFGSLAGSSDDSRSGSRAELDSGPGSVTSSGMVADPNTTTWLDFVTAECFRFSILRLTMGSSARYDQSLHNTCMSNASVGTLSNNTQILCNFNIGWMHDLVLFLIQSFLLCLGILLVAGTMAELPVVVVDSVVAE